jgi:predicted TIM-barrel fold metal-dependent hydrolase
MNASSATEIRAGLSHPVVDADGHCIEFFPALADYLSDEGVDPTGPSMKRLLPGAFGPFVDWYALDPGERARRRVARPPWWGTPARNTRDLATALFPELFYERLDELGIDFSVVYPSVGLAFLHLDDEAERRGACRALNRCNADAFAGLGDRLTPVAAIPMHTPEEACDALTHAVDDLCFRAVLLAGYVQRPAAAVADEHPDAAPWALWIDMYGIDSAYDYDPVWQRCRDLRVSPAFHSGSIGWGSRRSISNYMYNHLGHLAEGQHSLCKSLFIGGVTRRFPDLAFAFLEGGVAWAVSLYADLLGHWEKRNRAALEHLDPASIDGALFADLFARYGGEWVEAAARGGGIRRLEEDPAQLDEWAACEITRAEDIYELFVPRFYFGCEADDPLTATAFDTRLNAFGARLNAMFGSDVAHWDVPDMAGVLHEAWEMVERGLLTERDFADFMFANPVRFLTAQNPAFFDGTVLDRDARAIAVGAGASP